MSDLTQPQVVTRAVFLVSMIVTTVLASLYTWGSTSALNSRWGRLVVLVAMVGAVSVGFDRNLYLPFLGATAMPPSVLKLGVPDNATLAVSVDVPKDVSYVMYWAANPSLLPSSNPKDAYSKFTNAGVVQATQGRVTLRLQCPGGYRVGWGRLLPRHVHYRYVYNNGMASEVKTAYVTCPKI